MQISEQNSEYFHKWFFLLEEHDGKVALVLQQVKRIYQSPGHNDDSILDITPEGTILPATPPASASSTSSQNQQAHTAIVKHYNQIFSSFYSLHLLVPPDNFTSTLATCESLVKIASSLACTHLIAPSLSTTLQAHRLTLFLAIAHDPPRYLNLSRLLEDTCIYTEALIHIIGAWPSWPWPSARDTLPDALLKLVVRKAAELETLCIEAERDLLLLTIHVHNGPVEPQHHSQFDTWFVVQTFRDTLARTFHELDGDKSRRLKRGLLFRKIRRGGSAYMPYEEMRRLMERVMPSAVGNLEEDLAMLKEYASGIVEDVAKNELMLDVEANRVGYLTCVEIGGKDVPWRASGEGSS